MLALQLAEGDGKGGMVLAAVWHGAWKGNHSQYFGAALAAIATGLLRRTIVHPRGTRSKWDLDQRGVFRSDRNIHA